MEELQKKMLRRAVIDFGGRAWAPRWILFVAGYWCANFTPIF